ncbi:hypothetical protein [Sphingorhabdus sp.]|uniref:hypothetical protein n=1 Tax=Sphingorhabdus sp. TaxID=1902408 RepID=UPI003983D2CB
MRQNTPPVPTRAIFIAFCSGAVVAIGMMFVPMPLADESRTFVAFVTGAIPLCRLTIRLLRTNESGIGVEEIPVALANSGVQSNKYIPRYLSAKLHKAQKEKDVGGSPDLPEIQPKEVEALPDVGSGEQTLELVEVAPDSPIAPASSTIANMVAQLESAVAHRHVELAQLEEKLFNPLAKVSGQNSDEPDHADMDSEESRASESRRPVLELVPSDSKANDEVDSALAAALATLHRMNAAAR